MNRRYFITTLISGLYVASSPRIIFDMGANVRKDPELFPTLPEELLQFWRAMDNEYRLLSGIRMTHDRQFAANFVNVPWTPLG